MWFSSRDRRRELGEHHQGFIQSQPRPWILKVTSAGTSCARILHSTVGTCLCLSGGSRIFNIRGILPFWELFTDSQPSINFDFF